MSKTRPFLIGIPVLAAVAAAAGLVVLIAREAPLDVPTAHARIDRQLADLARQERYLQERLVDPGQLGTETPAGMAARYSIYRDALRRTHRLLARPGWPDDPDFRAYWEAVCNLVEFKLERCSAQVEEWLAAGEYSTARRRLFPPDDVTRLQVLLEVLVKAERKLQDRKPSSPTTSGDRS